MRRWRITEEDSEDLAQILWVTALEKQSAYDPGHESGAPLEAFLSQVMDNAIINFIELRKAEKRGAGVKHLSLEQEIRDPDGNACLLSDTLPERNSQFRATSPEADFSWDMERLFSGLSKDQQRIGRLIIYGFTVKEIAIYLNKPWSTIKDEIKRIAVTLYQCGLKDYLPDSFELPKPTSRSVISKVFSVLSSRDPS